MSVGSKAVSTGTINRSIQISRYNSSDVVSTSRVSAAAAYPRYGILLSITVALGEGN